MRTRSLPAFSYAAAPLPLSIYNSGDQPEVQPPGCTHSAVFTCTTSNQPRTPLSRDLLGSSPTRAAATIPGGRPMHDPIPRATIEALATADSSIARQQALRLLSNNDGRACVNTTAWQQMLFPSSPAASTPSAAPLPSDYFSTRECLSLVSTINSLPVTSIMATSTPLTSQCTHIRRSQPRARFNGTWPWHGGRYGGRLPGSTDDKYHVAHHLLP